MPSTFLDVFDWRALGTDVVIGVDEVGRGCLAGPVFAAAVILNPKEISDHFRDSKLLSAEKRKKFAAEIRMKHKYYIASASVEEIDSINILQASFLAMKRAVIGLRLSEADIKIAHVLVDGKFTIPDLSGYKQTPLIKGDQRAKPIAAASILAKVDRDALCEKLAETFPQYGFEKHKAYATAEHRSAIEKFGPCAEHRKTFGGVKEFWKN